MGVDPERVGVGRCEEGKVTKVVVPTGVGCEVLGSECWGGVGECWFALALALAFEDRSVGKEESY